MSLAMASILLISLALFPTPSAAQAPVTIVIDSDLLIIEGDGDANPQAFKGIPFTAWVLPEGIAVFNLVGDLVIADGDTVRGQGSHGISLRVTGNVVIAGGAVIDMSAGGNTPGPGGGAGGDPGQGGDGGLAGDGALVEMASRAAGGDGGRGGWEGAWCFLFPIRPGDNGLPGSQGENGVAGENGFLGGDGAANPGDDGVGSPASGGNGGLIGFGGNPGDGGLAPEGGMPGNGGQGKILIGLEVQGEDGHEGYGNDGQIGTDGFPGGGGSGGLNTGTGSVISGGGGGSSGSGGGGGGGSGGGSIGSGGGGGGGTGGNYCFQGADGGTGGWGSLAGGNGGAGGSGGEGGVGGNGGGAFEIVATGRMIASGAIFATGSAGSPGSTGLAGTDGGPGTSGWPGTQSSPFLCIKCSYGGRGGDGGFGGKIGGTGGAGGDGGSGAGGTIKLAAYIIDTSGLRVNTSGGTLGSPGSMDGGNGRFILEQTVALPLEATIDGARIELYSGSLPLSAIQVVGVEAVPFGQIMDGGAVASEITQLIVSFSEDAFNPPGDGDTSDVTNPSNYVVMNKSHYYFPILSVSYDNHGGVGPFQATVTMVKPLKQDTYILTVRGTSSIFDLFGFPLAGDGQLQGTDFRLTFFIRGKPLLPSTGFAPGQTTHLPAQPEIEVYRKLGNLWLEIPSLDIKAPIVGVPLSADGWNVEWLEGSVGYLFGTTFPTWPGNSVLTAHVYDADGQPGLFVDLGRLHWGQYVIIHFDGQRYTYEVRSVDRWTSPTDTRILNLHEDYAWITLVTCNGFDEKANSYRWRTVVRAVLVTIVP